jgi:Bacterial Ig-like domain (group 3)
VTTSTLAVGNHIISATYNGDGTFGSSSASLTQSVIKANTTVTVVSSQNPSTFGQAVTFTATVSGSGGTLIFTDTTTSQTLGTITLVATGIGTAQAAVTTSTLAVGTHSIQATYSGDTKFNGNLATVSQGVNQTTSTTKLISSANPSAFGQSVTFTATVSGTGAGTPTGSVTFTDLTAGQTLGTVTLGGGQSTLTTSALAGGTHVIRAAYSSDNNFGVSSATLVQVVNKIASTITLTSSLNPSALVSR